MHAYRQPDDVGNQHQPLVGVWLVRVILPLEDQPEDQGGQHGGERVDFALHGREPERVGEGVGQRSHDTTADNRDGLPNGQLGFALS